MVRSALAMAMVATLLAVSIAPASGQTATNDWRLIDTDLIPAADLAGYGSTLALSGDGLTVATVGWVSGSTTTVVVVYRLINEKWTPIGNQLTEAEDYGFGNAMALSDDGNTLIIGAPLTAGGPFDAPYAGRVRVYRLTSGSWTQLGSNLNGPAGWNSFGLDVDISADGNTIIAGGVERPGGVYTNYAKVFTLTSGDWAQTGADLIGDPGGYDSNASFAELSSDGTIAVIGSGSSTPGSFTSYALGGSGWVAFGGSASSSTDVYLHQSPTAALSGDGETLIVGQQNRAEVYRLTNGAWTQLGTSLTSPTTDDAFGSSVAISHDGSQIIVGAPQLDENEPVGGSAYVYELSGGVWAPRGSTIIGAAGDHVGSDAGMSGDGQTIAVGAYGFDDGYSRHDVGHVQVFGYGPATVTAVDDIVSLSPLTSITANVAGNDPRADPAAPYTLTILAAPTAGSAQIQAGAISYTPVTHSVTSDSLEYQICVASECSSATLSITINPPRCKGAKATIWGTAGGSTAISGTGGADVIVGSNDNDVIHGNGGKDRVCGRGGDDSITTGDKVDWIHGESGDDVIDAGGGSDRIYGGSGNDIVRAGSGADRVYGGAGDDQLFGMGGSDFMRGQDGDDLLQGNANSDRLFGDEGDDTLRGSSGKDKLYGGGGNDAMFGGLNSDWLDGGLGIDYANGQTGKENPFMPGIRGCIAETRILC